MADPKIYTVGWVCGLLTEFIAAKACLDEAHPTPSDIVRNHNNDIVFALGQIKYHNVVIAVTLNGEHKPGSAAVVARSMLDSFPNIRVGLLVGVGVGTPISGHDVRLGDIVVGTCDGGEGGILQYDIGTSFPSQKPSSERTRSVNRPPEVLQRAIDSSDSNELGNGLDRIIKDTLRKWPYLQDYARPLSYSSRLYELDSLRSDSEDDYNIASGGYSGGRDDVDIHYGLIASSSQITNVENIRGYLTEEKGILCFETQAAGLPNHFPCLMIRGICGYSESQTDKKWEKFAAIAAAVYTTEVLRNVRPETLETERPIRYILGSMQEDVSSFRQDVIGAKTSMTSEYEQDINEQEGKYADEDGNALQLAAEKGDTETIRTLLSKGADVNAKGGQYGSALQAASKEGYVDIVIMLLRNGADVNAQGGQYGSALQAASKEGHVSIVQMLLDYGAYVEQGDALQIASKEGHVDIVRMLLKYGADVKAQGGRYGSALQAALEGGHAKIAELLFAEGAPLSALSGSYGSIVGSVGYHNIERVLQEAADLSLGTRFWCQWDIPEVYLERKKERALSTRSEILAWLSGSIILTGYEETFECSTCSDFLHKEWHYPGSVALRIMSIGIGSCVGPEPFNRNPNRIPKRFDMEGFRIIDASREGIEVLFQTTCHEAKSIIDAMTWISTAIRSTPPTTASTSPKLFRSINVDLQASLAFHAFRAFRASRASRASRATYWEQPISGLLPLEEWCPVSSSTCWTELFQTGVIASRRLRRDWGKGLEMSFDMMVRLASVENYYQLNDNIVLLGFATALIPVERRGDSKSIQWHLETVEDLMSVFKQPSKLLTVQETSETFKDKAEFQNSRCFVGWSEEAHILLGTYDLLEKSNMTWSQTRERRRTLHRKGVEAGGQLGISLGPINIAPQGIQAWEFTSNVRMYDSTMEYRKALKKLERRVAIVIDAETKIAWLVPVLSLILHLCHLDWKKNNTEKPYKDSPIPFANPAHDGHQAALNALELEGDAIVLGKLGEPDTETLRQHVLRICASLGKAAKTMENPTHDTIFAIELMEIIDTPFQGSPLRKVDASGSESLFNSWEGIVKRVDVVGVCARLGSAIEPLISPTTECSSCRTLPSGKYYLAAHTKCLMALSETAGSGSNGFENGRRLGHETFWCTGSSPWSSCPHADHARIQEANVPYKGLQYISTKKPRENPSLVASDQVKGASVVVAGVADPDVVDTGVVVFGTEHKRVKEWPKRMLSRWT